MPTVDQPHRTPEGLAALHYDPDFPLMFGGTGAWQLYSYNAVLQVLSDYRTFSNAYMPKGEQYLIGSNLNQTDPPLHSALRAIVAGPFKRQAIEDKAPSIRNRAARLLDNMAASAELDFVNDLAFPLSAAIICDMMGIPEQVHQQVNTWAKAIVTAGYSPGGLEIAREAQQQMAGLFSGLLQERSKEPLDDVLTLLARSSVEDTRLSPAIQIGSCMTILLAGHETTASLLANALYMFAKVPGLWQALQTAPGLLAPALREVLRLRPSIVSMYRVAAADTVIEGQLIKQGDMVNAWISAANRDGQVFEQPETFSLTRHNYEKVLSFGKGVHHCLGDHLATAEALIFFELVLSKVVSVEITGEPTLVESPIVNGFQRFPVRFTHKS